MHFAVGGEKDRLVPFCKWLMDGTTNGLESINSEIHGISIDFDSMIGFFTYLHNREEGVRGQGELEPTGSQLLPLLKEKTSGRRKGTIRLIIITEIFLRLSRSSRSNSQEKSTHAAGTISVIVIMRPLR